MERRTVILTVGGSLLASPFASHAQSPTKVWRIGYLAPGARPPDGAPPAALRQALEQLGYVNGKNVTYTSRWAEAKVERLPGLAAELVAVPVDLLLTVGAPAADAAKDATSTIPIVLVTPGDVDATGLVTNLARPGRNITGIDDPATELSAKRFELLKEAVPSATRVAVIWNENDRAMTLRYGEVPSRSFVSRARVAARRGERDLDLASRATSPGRMVAKSDFAIMRTEGWKQP